MVPQQRALTGEITRFLYTKESVAFAVELFEQSVAEDAHFAQPWSGLAEAHALAAVLGWSRAHEVMPRAREAALRALEIDEGVSQAHAALALVLFRYDYDWEAAEREYARAIELSPGSGELLTWYSSFLVFTQRPEEAIRTSRRAAALDPLSVEASRVVADTLYFCRRYGDSVEECAAILARHPDYYFAEFFKGMAVIAQGEIAAGVDALETADRLAGGQPLTRATLGWGLGRAGEEGRSREVLAELVQARDRGDVPDYFMAMVYVGRGEHDRALDSLEAALDQRDALLPVLEVDQMWDPLRSDDRCTGILESIGLG